MDNSFLVGLSAQMALRQRMDVTANNLANMTTSGFKAERLVMRDLEEKPAQASEKPKDIAFVDVWQLQRDFSAGPVEHTGNPLDLAIESEGFFVVQTPAGQAYTRDGHFSLDGTGRLVTRGGYPVLGGGAPIQLDPNLGEIQVTRDGRIMQQGVEAGALDTVAFDTPSALEKVGDNLWKGVGQPPRPPQSLRISSGFLEGSNVNAISELTEMIEISRAYQSVSKMISQADELRQQSIEKLSQVGAG